MQDHRSILASWTGSIARALEARGINSAETFAKAGLDIAETQDPNARYPHSKMKKLWETCVEVSGDPGFALSTAEYRSPIALHGTGLAIDASSTVRESLERLVKLSSLVSNHGKVDLAQRDDGHWALGWTADPEVMFSSAKEEMDAYASAVMLKLDPEDIVEMHFIRKQPDDPSPWQKTFLNIPLHFKTNRNEIIISRDAIDRPFQEGNPTLAMMGESVALDQMQKNSRKDILLNVSDAIRNSLLNGEPKQQDIAATLNISPRQLQRKLTDKETSFSQILKEVRHQLARDYLQDLTLSVMEISLNLGFSDASNFSSAFKRWEGQSPKCYREALKAQHHKNTPPTL